MTVKIRDKIVLDDGQSIYILGRINLPTFQKFYNSIDYISFMDGMSTEQASHFAMKSIIKDHHVELAEWFFENTAKVTCWVDPVIFDAVTVYSLLPPYNSPEIFPWGVGFQKNDPIEEWFVMRWT